MKRAFIYIAGRWYEARAQKALAKYLELKAVSEKFFARLGGGE